MIIKLHVKYGKINLDKRKQKMLFVLSHHIQRIAMARREQLALLFSFMRNQT